MSKKFSAIGGLMRSLMRPQDWGNLILGIWLLISTLLLFYPTALLGAGLNFYLAGIAIVVFSVCVMYVPKVLAEGVNVVLGLWMIASPWVLRFDPNRALTASAVIVGLAVVILAAWAIAVDEEFLKWRHDRSALY